MIDEIWMPDIDVPAEESGCRCCERCTPVFQDGCFRCPYGGPFNGYQDTLGRPLDDGD